MGRKKSRIEYIAAVGEGEFPFDMLRYDFCAPATERFDSPGLSRYSYDSVRVVVVRRVIAPEIVGGDWTPDRWRSFGWHVTEPCPDESTARAEGERIKAELERRRSQKT